MSTKNKKRGIAILYAVLLVSIIISVGLILIDIITKQIVLSSIGKNSQLAYYAANAGKECAYVWDAVPGAFDFSPGQGGDSRLTTITCASNDDGQPMSLDVAYDPPDGSDNTTYEAILNSAGSNKGIDIPAGDQSYCARVTVTKTAVCSDDLCRYKTSILSKGYNVSCAQVDTGGNRIVERAVILK